MNKYVSVGYVSRDTSWEILRPMMGEVSLET